MYMRLGGRYRLSIVELCAIKCSTQLGRMISPGMTQSYISTVFVLLEIFPIKFFSCEIIVMDNVGLNILYIKSLIDSNPGSYDDIGNALNNLEKILEKENMSQNDRLLYCVSFHEEFQMISSYLEDKQLIKATINKQKVSLLRYLQTIFKTYFKFDKYLSDVLHETAMRFSEFMKGITFFKGLDVEVLRPIYHRTTSCGVSKKDATYASKHLDCNGVVDDTDEYERRRTNVRNCLIERLVYGLLFTKYYKQNQDLGHSYQILHVDHFHFQSCYQGSVLSVHPLSFVGDIPISLTIETVNSNKSIIEVYTKTFDASSQSYHPNVDCQRTIIDKETHVRIDERKVQTFDSQKNWKDQKYVVAGGSNPKIRILGRSRCIVKIGRKQMIKYKGKYISLSDAKRIEKGHKI